MTESITHLPISLPHLAATEQLAQQIAPYLVQGDVLALQGDLGAGKTAFARAILRTMGVGGEIPSPTFTLIQMYETSECPVAHFDLYRLKSENELDELGWDDALADGISIIEWPERAGRHMPKNYLLLHFELDARGQRICQIKPQGNWVERWSA